MKYFRLTLAASVLLALVLGFSLRSTPPSEETATQRVPPRLGADVTAPDQRYLNTDAGVAFVIPPGVRLADGTAGNLAASAPLELVVRIERMENIPAQSPFPGYDRKSAEETERALANGTLPAVTVDNPVGAMTIKKIDGDTNALVYPVFSRSPCSVTFELIAMLFRGGHRIFLSLRASPGSMIPLKPSLFTVNEPSCGMKSVWKNSDAPKEFLKLLTDGTSAPAHTFMAAFSRITDSIRLTP